MIALARFAIALLAMAALAFHPNRVRDAMSQSMLFFQEQTAGVRGGGGGFRRGGSSSSSSSAASEDEESFAACLIVMDDNHRLVEWLAYHYWALPLRRLVIAVDPVRTVYCAANTNMYVCILNRTSGDGVRCGSRSGGPSESGLAVNRGSEMADRSPVTSSVVHCCRSPGGRTCFICCAYSKSR